MSRLDSTSLPKEERGLSGIGLVYLNPYIVLEPSPGRLFHMLLTRQVSDSLRPVPNDPKPLLRCSSAKLLCFLAVLRDLDRSGMFKWVKLKCQKQSLQRPTISAETESLQEMVRTR